MERSPLRVATSSEDRYLQRRRSAVLRRLTRKCSVILLVVRASPQTDLPALSRGLRNDFPRDLFGRSVLGYIQIVLGLQIHPELG